MLGISVNSYIEMEQSDFFHAKQHMEFYLSSDRKLKQHLPKS